LGQGGLGRGYQDGQGAADLFGACATWLFAAFFAVLVAFGAVHVENTCLVSGSTCSFVCAMDEGY
jgi:hypothetical protein